MAGRWLALVTALVCAVFAFACVEPGGPTAVGTATSPPRAANLAADVPAAAVSDIRTTLASAVGISDRGLYIALGDSLSAGIGASDASTTFVSRVRAGLGPGIELQNLGISGATSQDLLDGGTLDQAVQEIVARNQDGDPNNDVRLVTLEIGGNDLLRLYGGLVLTSTCVDAQTALSEPECAEALRAALDGFRPNLTAALDRLRDADPSLPILLLTLYNPFQHVPGVGELSDLSLEGKPDTPFPEGLNDIMRGVASGRADVTVADVYEWFNGRSLDFISGDGIHPNDAGYGVMASAVTAAIARLTGSLTR